MPVSEKQRQREEEEGRGPVPEERGGDVQANLHFDWREIEQVVADEDVRDIRSALDDREERPDE